MGKLYFLAVLLDRATKHIWVRLTFSGQWDLRFTLGLEIVQMLCIQGPGMIGGQTICKVGFYLAERKI